MQLHYPYQVQFRERIFQNFLSLNLSSAGIPLACPKPSAPNNEVKMLQKLMLLSQVHFLGTPLAQVSPSTDFQYNQPLNNKAGDPPRWLFQPCPVFKGETSVQQVQLCHSYQHKPQQNLLGNQRLK